VTQRPSYAGERSRHQDHDQLGAELEQSAPAVNPRESRRNSIGTTHWSPAPDTQTRLNEEVARTLHVGPVVRLEEGRTGFRASAGSRGCFVSTRIRHQAQNIRASEAQELPATTSTNTNWCGSANACRSDCPTPRSGRWQEQVQRCQQEPLRAHEPRQAGSLPVRGGALNQTRPKTRANARHHGAESWFGRTRASTGRYGRAPTNAGTRQPVATDTDVCAIVRIDPFSERRFEGTPTPCVLTPS